MAGERCCGGTCSFIRCRQAPWEKAIHFGLLGPLLYIAGEGKSLAPILDTAKEMMLAGMTETEEAVCDLSDAQSIVKANSDVSEMIQKFSHFNSGKR